MSGNTLTTERVRSSFIWAEEESPAHILPSVLGEEFDRWLAEVKTQEVSDLIARIEMAVVLLEDGEITPTGRRMIEKVLSHYRQGETE